MAVNKCIAASFATILMLVASVVMAAPTKLGPDTVVASQGGASVRLRDVDAFARTVPPDHLAELFSSPDRIESILRNLLAEKQLLNEAKKLKLQDRPQVAADMQRAVDAVLVKARIAALQKKATGHVPNLEELAHERYLANPAHYGVPKVVDVKHILIGTKDRSDAEAKALADKIYGQLKNDPSQFDADITKYSDDPSKAHNHGLITNATSKTYVSEFREAADRLAKVGDISHPVKSQFGYHIIKLVKLTPGKKRSYAEVKKDLVASLRADYIAKQVQHHLNVIRNRTIDPNPAAIAALSHRYPAPQSAAKSKSSTTAVPAVKTH